MYYIFFDDSYEQNKNANVTHNVMLQNGSIAVFCYLFKALSFSYFVLFKH